MPITLPKPLTVGVGGTGQSTLTQYGLVVGAGTGAVAAVGPDSGTTTALFAAGASANPAFRAIASTDLPQIRSKVIASTGNGEGSSNTAIMRFSSNSTSGSDITYADSSTNGATFTIATAGLYFMNLVFEGATNTAANAGISLNSAQLTTSISSITAANRIGWGYMPAISGDSSVVNVSIMYDLAVNDVIRAHTSVSPTNTSSRTKFTIIRIGV